MQGLLAVLWLCYWFIYQRNASSTSCLCFCVMFVYSHLFLASYHHQHPLLGRLAILVPVSAWTSMRLHLWQPGAWRGEGNGYVCSSMPFFRCKLTAWVHWEKALCSKLRQGASRTQAASSKLWLLSQMGIRFENPGLLCWSEGSQKL